MLTDAAMHLDLQKVCTWWRRRRCRTYLNVHSHMQPNNEEVVQNEAVS